MGGETILEELLSKVDLDIENRTLRRDLRDCTTEIARTKIVKRLKIS